MLTFSGKSLIVQILSSWAMDLLRDASVDSRLQLKESPVYTYSSSPGHRIQYLMVDLRSWLSFVNRNPISYLLILPGVSSIVSEEQEDFKHTIGLHESESISNRRTLK